MYPGCDGLGSYMHGGLPPLSSPDPPPPPLPPPPPARHLARASCWTSCHSGVRRLSAPTASFAYSTEARTHPEYDCADAKVVGNAIEPPSDRMVSRAAIFLLKGHLLNVGESPTSACCSKSGALQCAGLPMLEGYRAILRRGLKKARADAGPKAMAAHKT